MSIKTDLRGKSGILKGDIITKADGKEINKMVELREYLYSKKPGEKIKLTLENSNLKEVEIELRKKIVENVVQNQKKICKSVKNKANTLAKV